MQDNKLIRFLIPVVAVIVIFESIMLVSNLEKENQIGKDSTNVPTKVMTESDDIKKTEESPVMDLAFVTASNEMKVGKSYKVELTLTGKKILFVDGIETYVKYNPELVTVSGLTSGIKLPKPSLSKIDSTNGIIKNIVLVDAKEGFEIVSGQVNQVLTFNVTPKKVGLIKFEISSGNTDKEFVTIIVETTTSKVLAFSGSNLEINAIK
jgi:hypothetical protein